MAAGANPTIFDEKGRSSIYWSLRNKDYDLFCFELDAYFPQSWNTLLDKRVEALLSSVPEVKLLKSN